MAQLYDTNGNLCGYIGNAQAVPAGGFFTRPDNAPTEMSSLTFFEKLGQARFTQIWTSAKTNNVVAYEMMKAATLQTMYAEPTLKLVVRLEKAGIIAVGTAQEIWT